MRLCNKLLIVGGALALLSGASFASCPDVGGYTLSSRGHGTCTYTSNGSGRIGINGAQATHQCPRFRLTDPGYHLVGSCRVMLRPSGLGSVRNACRCVISSRGH